MELLELYIALFVAFFKIGLFGFGGGYAMLSLIQHEVVEVHNWISINDFTDIVAISQTTPGPIAFNSATYIGYTAVTDMGYTTFQGVIGSAICTLAVSIPSLVIMTIVCAFFARLNNNPWMRAALSVLKIAIIGLIAAAALMLMDENNFIDYKSLIIFAVVLVASIKKVDPILLIILSGLAGLILY
ncbi:MAG: chromate transporter [Salinivirgaceae bacterium]|jgi:chromate transporter|nr:chromate transporter [Bacteroidales bacterium]